MLSPFYNIEIVYLFHNNKLQKTMQIYIFFLTRTNCVCFFSQFIYHYSSIAIEEQLKNNSQTIKENPTAYGRRRKMRWKIFFHEPASKREESVVASIVRTIPIGSIAKVLIHIPIGPIALSRTAFSAIMPTT